QQRRLSHSSSRRTAGRGNRRAPGPLQRHREGPPALRPGRIPRSLRDLRLARGGDPGDAIAQARAVKKPLNIVYGVEDVPPLGVTLVSGVQHVVVIAIWLLFPLLVAREAGLSAERTLDVLGVSMLIMGLGPLLQAMTRGPVGSG